MKNYQQIIDSALTRIKDQQSPDGSFVSLSGFMPDDFSDAIPRRTTFFTANILACLQNIPTTTDDVRHAAATFLLGQKNERWSFNYWARGVENSDESPYPYPPYPDDLDDTCAALVALARYDPRIIDGHVLAAVAKLLTAREVVVGGPYRTWLVADDAPAAWQDIDIIVNSTIGYFLSLVDVQLPHLENFINNSVNEDRLTSPYYPGIFHVGYFLSRFYKSTNDDAGSGNASACAKLADILTARLDQRNDEKITPLERAMAISSLINLGYPERVTPVVIDPLVARIEREGFRPYAFCIDPARDGRRCYAGASALTAAFSAEALALYSLRSYSYSTGTTAYPSISYDHIHSLARAACRELDPDLRATAIAQIENTSDEKITALAYDFREVLYKNGVIIPLEIVEQLSLANLYGWMAYTIYDDALDGEDGQSFLPCANFFLRMLAEIYLSLDSQIPGAQSQFINIMNRIDAANAWEQVHCRIASESGGAHPHALPSFGDHTTLADRSIGHAMGPLAELLYAGFGADSEEYKNVECFFRHYLIARQLHDDAHDWADDLLRGRINSVSTRIIDNSQNKPIFILLPELKKIFWKEVIDEVVDLILSHIASARSIRDGSRLLNGSDFMEHALQTLERGARRAIKERGEAFVFLNDYRASRPPGAQTQK